MFCSFASTDTDKTAHQLSTDMAGCGWVCCQDVERFKTILDSASGGKRMAQDGLCLIIVDAVVESEGTADSEAPAEEPAPSEEKQ